MLTLAFVLGFRIDFWRHTQTHAPEEVAKTKNAYSHSVSLIFAQCSRKKIAESRFYFIHLPLLYALAKLLIF